MTLPRPWFLLPILLLALIMAGCSTTGTRKGGAPVKQGGGYYKDDGPGDNPPADIEAIPDAVPRIERLASGPNKPYVVFGQRYVPNTDEVPFRQQGIASWYGRKFHGNATSSGEPYDMYAMTAAHPTLPIPSYARVTSKLNGRTVVVRVNDRGPFHSNRIMDLSYAAAYKLGIVGPGSGPVTVERILPSEIRAMANQPAPVQSAAVETRATPIPEVLSSADLPPLSGGHAARGDAPAPASGIYLQLGAFSQQANAQSLASRVNEQLAGEAGTPAVIERTDQLYRVRIGPYASREAALEAVPQVNARTGILPSLSMR